MLGVPLPVAGWGVVGERCGHLLGPCGSWQLAARPVYAAAAALVVVVWLRRLALLLRCAVAVAAVVVVGCFRCWVPGPLLLSPLGGAAWRLFAVCEWVAPTSVLATERAREREGGREGVGRDRGFHNSLVLLVSKCIALHCLAFTEW